jgi:hypothetical protein
MTQAGERGVHDQIAATPLARRISRDPCPYRIARRAIHVVEDRLFVDVDSNGLEEELAHRIETGSASTS